MSSLILALIDNAGYVAYTTPSEPTPQDTGAITKDADPKMNQPDPEAFRLLYATHFTRMEPYYPGKLTGVSLFSTETPDVQLHMPLTIL